MNMLVVYDTLTKNTERFVKKLPSQFRCYHIKEYDGTTPFILATYTINFGQIPKSTDNFLKVHGGKMIGVASSGNKNWGGSFAIAADKISSIYKVPVILKFELQGNLKDVEEFVKRSKGLLCL